jgi:hypothetical protein
VEAIFEKRNQEEEYSV